MRGGSGEAQVDQPGVAFRLHACVCRLARHVVELVGVCPVVVELPLAGSVYHVGPGRGSDCAEGRDVEGPSGEVFHQVVGPP